MSRIPFMRTGVSIFLLLATGAAAHAATLTTVPFPGQIVSTGEVRCFVSNQGTKAGTVTAEVIDGAGAVLTSTSESLAAGGTLGGQGSDLADSSPVRCRITVPSKANFRGSLVYLNGSASPVVIPAQ